MLRRWIDKGLRPRWALGLINKARFAAERRSIEAARLQVDALKWTSGRMHPGRWGKQVAITGSDESAPPVEIDWRNVPTEILEQLDAIGEQLTKYRSGS